MTSRTSHLHISHFLVNGYRNLLANICDIDINTTGDKKRKIIAKIVEVINYCRNSKLVLINHFLENFYVTRLPTDSLTQTSLEAELLVDHIRV